MAKSFPTLTMHRLIIWRCRHCGGRTPERIRVGRFVRIPPPSVETIDLTCDDCERKRRDRILNGWRSTTMTTPTYLTLDSLQAACTDAVFALPLPEGSVGADVCRAPTDNERRGCDLIVNEAVKWLAETEPPRTRRARERMFDEVTQRAERAICGLGLFILIGDVIFSWILRKTLDWLWNWFTETKEAPALICGMTARLTEA